MRKTNDWLSYDTTCENLAACIRVDMHPVRSARERNAMPFLLILRLATKKSYAMDHISPFQQLLLEQAYKRVLKKADAAFVRVVGVKTWGSNIEIYAYGSDEPALLTLVKLCEKRAGLIVEYETHEDVEWWVYRKEVYPDAAARQTVKNAETIELMEKHGDDIHAPRRINHYCSFNDEIARLGFQDSARKAGFAIGDSFFIPDRDLPHGMCVRHIGSIDKPSLDLWTNKLIAIVEAYHGRYDYWDCQIMRKSRTRGVPAKKNRK